MATTTNSTTTHYPDDFKCPISLKIMSEPVILSSGHTFDRTSIQRWLDAGHRTNPISKLPLSDSPTLIHNHALRSLISTYTNSAAGVTLSKSNHIQEHPETLIANLTSKSSSPEVKMVAIERLFQLSKRDFELRKRLTESWAVAALISLKEAILMRREKEKIGRVRLREREREREEAISPCVCFSSREFSF